MKKSNLVVLLIPLTGILTLFSCSSDENSNTTTKYDYCVYMENEICLSGSYENCPNGGTPSNTCPSGFDKGSQTENNSSSSKNIFGGSSNSSGGYTGVYGSVEHCGKKYKTVVIGTQTWFAENVNCPTDEGSKCYDDDPINCSKYGRLYDWETAMTVCPTGWNLPDKTELETLINIAGGKDLAGEKLKAINGWNNSGNGTDELGFSALAGGGFDPNKSSFDDIGEQGKWWSSTKNGHNGYYYFSIRSNRSKVSISDGDDSKEYMYYSVRCIKN